MNDLTHSGFGANSPARMTSIEIAELTGKRHDNVRRTIETLADKGIIQLPQIEEIATGARAALVYILSGEQGKRDSYVVVAQLSPEFTARLVDRWQELERSNIVPFAIPTSYADALRLAADNAERADKAEARLIEDAPKVAFATQVEVAPDAISIGQAAKLLGTGRNRFCSLLRQHHWLTRTNEPYQDKINAGLLDVKIGSWEHPDKGLQRSVTALVTGKGLARLHGIVSPNASPNA